MAPRVALTRLGRSARSIARLAFGCEQLGGFQWGTVDPHEVQSAIELAVEQGVTLFDTADCYARGESERRLGQILAPHAERALIATKFGVRFSDSGSVYYDASPAWAQEALEGSLRRLGRERVDLFQLHHWDGRTALDSLFERLEKLRERGLIRWYGVTNCLPGRDQLTAYPGLATVSLEYSLAHRQHEHSACELAAAGLTFIAYGALGQGVLSGKYRQGAQFGSDDRRSRSAYRNFHGERFARNCRIVEVLEIHARTVSASPSQLALAWILHRIPDSVVLVGIKRPAQLLEATAAVSLQLSHETLAALHSITTQDLAAAGAQ